MPRQTAVGIEQAVHWPSDGVSEVPFRVYTDRAQYGPCAWTVRCTVISSYAAS